jgi:hypothetical protein
VETTAPQAALDPLAGAGPGGADVVVVLDEDLSLPPREGDHDVVMTSTPEPSPVAEVVDPSPTAEVPEPSRPWERWRLLWPRVPSPSKR